MLTSPLSENQIISIYESTIDICLQKIKGLFCLIMEKQNQNLVLKKKLFSYKYFYPDILFLKLDYFSKKSITALDIMHYLEQHKYKFNDEIIRRFIKQYDKHGNVNLIYEDFLNIILPSNLEENNSNKEIIKNNNKIENYIDEIFCQILINEIKLIGLIGDEIINIIQINGFDSYKLFEKISNKKKYINNEIINNFLEQKFDEIQINRLIYFLDKNNDGLISYDDFHDLLIPIKGDFEPVENFKDNNLYVNYDNDYDMNYNYNENNLHKSNFDINRKTYYLNYYYKDSRNKIINNKYNYNKEKGLISKYLNKTQPIHEINEIYENDIYMEQMHLKNLSEYNDNDIRILNNSLRKEKIEKNNSQNQSQDLNIKNENNNNNNYINNSLYYKNKENIDINNNITFHKFPITFGHSIENGSNKKTMNKSASYEIYPNNQEGYDINKNAKENLMPNKIINKDNHKYKLSKLKNNLLFSSYPNSNIKNNFHPFNLKSKLNLDSHKSYSCDYKLYEREEIGDENIEKNFNKADIMNKFFEYINLIIYYENRYEHIKESLSLRKDLSLKEIFYLFDKDKIKAISINNFKLICNKVFRIFPTYDQIKLVFKRYKKDLNINNKKMINYSLNQNEFIQMLTPNFSIQSNNISQNLKPKSRLSKKSKNILCELIKCLIIKESNYYKIRCHFEINNLEFIWKEINKFSEKEKSDNINKKEFNLFLEEYGYYFGEKNLEIIFSIFDKEKKKYFNDNDFFEEMCYN